MASRMSKTDLVTKAKALVANRNAWRCSRISYQHAVGERRWHTLETAFA
jgi:hypothetical protein